MFELIRRALQRDKFQAQFEANLAELCRLAGEQVAMHYGFRSTAYDILAETEQLCHELDQKDSSLK